MQNLATSVHVDVNKTHLIEGLRTAFASKLSVITELAHNARRAGATKVEILVDEKTIQFIDDGKGIADFSALLTIGGTNWEDEVAVHQAPYGLGFLAALFACRRIRVESRGTVLEADTADLLDLKPVALSSVPIHDGKTKVTLIDHSIEELGLVILEEAFQGFPIPVVIAGKEVDRGLSINQLVTNSRFVEVRCEAGCLFLLRSDIARKESSLFLQGAPISNGNKYLKSSHVLHLDPVQYKGNFPDRNVLYDESATKHAIATQMERSVQDYLASIKDEVLKSEDDVEFSRFANACLTWKCASLLDDVDMLPGNWFVDLDATLMHAKGLWWMRSSVLEGVVKRRQEPVITDVDFHESHGFAATTFAKAKGWLCIKSEIVNSLSKTHWIHELIVNRESGEPRSAVNADPAEFTVSGEGNIVEFDFVCNGEQISVVLCDRIVINNLHGSVDGFTFVFDGETLFDTGCNPDGLQQVSNFAGDWGDYDAELFESTADEYVNTIAHARNLSLTERFEMIFNQNRHLFMYEGFCNGSVLVTFDEKGTVTFAEGPAPHAASASE